MVAAAPAPASLEWRLDLSAEATEVGTARRFADAAAAFFGLDEEARYALTFAVNEAVSNAIEHGEPSPDGTIHLHTSEEEGALAFYVEDHGSFTAKPPSASDFPSRGRGLALMAAMVDEVDVRQGPAGTVVRLCQRLPSP